MDILTLLLILVVIGVAFWAVEALSGAFGIPAPIVVVVKVLLVIMGLLWVLSAFGIAVPLLHIG